MIAHKDIFTMDMGPVAHSANAIHTCSMFKTALTTSWAFKNSTLWRAWPIISAHLCNRAIIDCYKTTPKTNIIEICKGFRTEDIFHKNREISILTINKKTARLTLLQEATERTSQGETQNKTRKTHSSMNKSASLTLVQGPSTVACMIVT